MARRSKTGSTVSTVQLLAAVLVLIGVGIALALMFGPDKPEAPPVSHVSYAERPEARQPAAGRLPNEAPRLAQRLSHETGRGSAAIAETAAPPETAPYSATVRVVGAATGTALDDVRVVVSYSLGEEERAEYEREIAESAQAKDVERFDSLKARFQARRQRQVERTGKSGQTRFRLSAAGEYTVYADGPGYTPSETKTFQVNDDTPGAEIELVLSQGASISGRVKEAGTSKGAPELQVRVDFQGDITGSAEQARQAVFERAHTDAEGRYEVSGLVPGTYSVTVEVAQTPYMVGDVLPYREITVRRPDEAITNVDFEVEAAGVVWGYVTTPGGESIKGATLALCTSDSVLSQALNAMVKRAPPVNDTTDKEGYYELLGVPLNQEWRVYGTSKDFSPQLADPFILTPSERSVRLDLYMFAGSTVYGRVVDSRRRPVPGANVVCIPSFGTLVSPTEAPPAFRESRTEEAGTFEIEELPAGSYQLFAQKRGYKLRATGHPIYPDGYSPIRGIELVLQEAGTGDHQIYGTVMDPQETPLSGVDVRLEGIGTESFEERQDETTTGSDGTFVFDGVEVGMYSLVVHKEGYARKRVGRVLLDRENEIILEAAGLVRGRVLVKETRQAPESPYTVSWAPVSSSGAMLAAAGLRGAESKTFENPDGSFELSVPPGTQRLEATSADLTPGRVVVEVEAGALVDGIDIFLSETGGEITGRVVTGGSGSPQGAEVMLVEAGSALEAMAAAAAPSELGAQVQRVGEEGTFTFSQLPEGQYNVVARHPSYAPGQSGALTLEQGGRVDGVVVRLGTGGALEGYVYRLGEAVAGAVVMVMGSAGTETATTDDQGYYYVDELASGTYQVMIAPVSAGNVQGIYDTQGAEVVIEEGTTTRYDFGQGVGAAIEGRCTPPPVSLLGGRAVLRRPGMAAVPLGELTDVTSLVGQSTGIDPSGGFLIEDVPPGEWQLDAYYFELGAGNPLAVRYVATEVVTVTGEEEVVPVQLMVSY